MTETSLHILLNDEPAANSDFVAIHLPIVRMQRPSNVGPDTAMFHTILFQALERIDGVAGHLESTIGIQGSAAV